MLEKIDFDVSPISREEYKAAHDELIKRLVVLQQRAHNKGIGLVVLFEGWDGAGKGGRISDLLYYLDARATSVYVTENYDTKNAKRFRKLHLGASDYFPMMQRFWNALGPRGNMTIYDRGWYSAAVQRLMYAQSHEKRAKRAAAARKAAAAHAAMVECEQAGIALPQHVASLSEQEDSQALTHDEYLLTEYLTSTEAFERQLAHDGYIVVKFFLHIRKKTQRKRLEKLAADPATSWRVDEKALAALDDYDLNYEFYDALLPRTNYEFAPWVVLNGEDKRRANLGVVRTLVSVLDDAVNAAGDPQAQQAAEKALNNSSGTAQAEITDERFRSAEEEARVREENEALALEQSRLAPTSSRFAIEPDHPTLKGVDYHLHLEEDAYRSALKREQKRLWDLELEMYKQRIPLIVMYEGQDAAGKGGSIKRVAQALDARAYTIFPSPAPTKPELMHPFLWRYWTRLPKAGHVGIYDRSWYGRVLVERVEGFASPAEWARAYDEINEFERDLTDWGAILLKFWVEIDREEQLRRFEARAADPAKQWKITDEDWRNRDKYPQYRMAVEDMFRLTSTEYAPWIILESNDKRYARVKALRIINDALERRLKGK